MGTVMQAEANAGAQAVTGRVPDKRREGEMSSGEGWKMWLELDPDGASEPAATAEARLRAAT